MGDFNAEQLAPDTHDAPEARLVGQHTFFKKEDLNALSECRREQILDAGDRVKETRVGNELVAANTLFEKKAAKKVTYSKARRPANSPPYTHGRFSQIDYILANKRWKATISNSESQRLATIDPTIDHFPVLATLTRKYSMKTGNRKPPAQEVYTGRQKERREGVIQRDTGNGV